jgi:hypothetical protein
MFVFQSIRYRNYDTSAGKKKVLFRNYRFTTEDEKLANALRKNCGADYVEVTPGHIQVAPAVQTVRGARMSEIEEGTKEIT